MEDLFAVFLDSFFTEEMQAEINTSFSLFEFYEYHQAFQGLTDICHEHGNVANEDLQDRFLKEINDKLDFIIQQHGITLISEVTLNQKNQVLTALGHLQKLDDYGAVIRTLETFEDDISQLASVLSEMTFMEEPELHSIIAYVAPSTMRTMKQFAYQKEEEAISSEEPNYDLLENFKLFNEYTKNASLAHLMVSNGASLGNRFRDYLPFVENVFLEEKDDAKKTLNIFSLLSISSDGYNSPLLVYRKYSMQLLHDLNLVSKIEVILLKLIADYSEYKKVQYEKARLLEASAQSGSAS